MPAHPSTEPSPVEDLTQREREILSHFAEHKSDREIAERLMLSLNTVKWYARQIYAKLGVANRQTAVLRAQEMGLLAGAVPPLAPRAASLPTPLTPFVGRAEDIRRISQFLVAGDHRLMTLVGPGGMGKTRLAIQVIQTMAEQKVETVADGLHFVPLTAIEEWQMIVHAIAQAIDLPLEPGGVAPLNQLVDHLRQKRMVLVLDNFEHLIGVECNQLLLDLLRQAPHLRLLITSRSQINLYGEQIYPLAGLDVPTLSEVRQAGDPLTVMNEYAAVRLFDQCIRRFRPEFQLDESSQAAMVRICQAVGGMPLAIELAAGWIEILTVEEIAQEVERGMKLLETDAHGLPERQRSMRAVCDYSWRFLAAPEQLAMGQISIFRGGFDRAAAEAIAGITPKMLLGLSSKSWLRRGTNNRFDVHELLRQYCAEMLAQDDAHQAATRERHSAYYCTWLSRQEEELKGRGQRDALAAIALDLSNIFDAYSWAASHGHFDWLAPSITALGIFFQMIGDLESGVRFLARLCDVFTATAEQVQGTPAAANHQLSHARLLVQIGRLRSEQTLAEESNHYLGQALALLDSSVLGEMDTRQERAQVALELGYNTYMAQSDHAIAHFTESYAFYQALEDREGMAAARLGLGRAYRTAGALDQSRAASLESLGYYEAIGNVRGQSSALGALASISLLQAHFADAERFIRQSLALIRDSDRRQRGYALGLLGSTLFNRGLFIEAELALREAIDIYLDANIDWAITANMGRLVHVLQHTGRYAQVLRQLEVMQSIVDRTNAHGALRGIVSYLSPWKQGAIALAQGHHAEAHGHLARAVAAWTPVAYSRYERAILIGCLVCALRGLGRGQEAYAQLAAGLEDTLQNHSYRGLLVMITAAALLELDRGNIERSLELYTAVGAQPLAAHSTWYADIAGKEIASASNQLPADVADGARRRGEAADLWDIAQTLIEALPS